MGGCKRCRRRGDKGAFTSSAGDPRVPLYLPSVGIKCLSLDNGVTPRVFPDVERAYVVKIPKVFLASEQNRVRLFSLIEEEDISSGILNGEYSCVGLGRGDDNNERKFIGTLHVDNFYLATLCYQQLRFSFYDLYLLNDRMNIFTVEDRTVYSGPDIAG